MPEPDPWKVQLLFDEALQCPPEEWPAFLAQACGEDASLRRRVEELLSASTEVATFLPEIPADHMTAPISLKEPRSFGDYELLEEVARGGMGVVFKARDVKLKRLVALKLIHAGSFASEEVVKRFNTEAEAAAGLNHPNIVPIYEIGEVHGQQYISMGLIDGPNLRQHLAEKEFSPHQSAELVAVLARAVHHAHQHGVLHRDINPSNIIIDRAGAPYLTDFGIAKIAQRDSTLTHTTKILGTPSYMAPEQGRGDSKNVTTAADVYGLGAVLYVCLTGQPPFAGGTTYETIRKLLEEEPRPPSEWKRTVNRDLETICLKCLEKEPSGRYSSADLLAKDLQRWIDKEPIEARPQTGWYRLNKWIQRRPAIATLTALSLLLVLGLTVGSILAALKFSALNKELTAKLWESYLADAKIAISEKKPGHRVKAFDLLKKAAAIKSSIEVRNAAVAALISTDIQPIRRWPARPDGEKVFLLDSSLEHYAEGSPTGTLQIHRVSDGAVISTLAVEDTPLDRFPGWSWSGNYLAVNYSDRMIRLWDIAGSRVVLSQPGDRAAIDRAQQVLAIGRLSGSLLIYDLATQSQLPVDLPIEPSWLAFSPDGKRLAVSSESHQSVVIVDSQNGQIRYELRHPTIARQISWSADNSLIACPLANGEIHIWDTTTGRRLRILRGHGPNVVSLAFGRGTYLLSSGLDGTTRIWDAASGEESFKLNDLAGCLHMNAARGEVGLVDWNRSRMSLCKVEFQEILRKFNLGVEDKFGPADKFFSKDGSLLLMGSGNSTSWILNSRTGQILGRMNGVPDFYASMAPSGNWIATESGAGAHLWPVKLDSKSRELVVGPPVTISQTPVVDWVRFSSDNKGLFFVEDKLILKSYSLLDLSPLHSPLTLSYFPDFFKVSPSGDWIASSVHRRPSFSVYHLVQGEFQAVNLSDNQQKTYQVFDFHPAGNQIVMSDDNEISIRELNTWNKMYGFPSTGTNGPFLRTVSLPESGAFVVHETDGRSITISRFPSFELLVTLPETKQSDSPRYSKISPCGRFLAGNSSSGSGWLELWNLELLWSQLNELGFAWSNPGFSHPAPLFDPEPESIRVIGKIDP